MFSNNILSNPPTARPFSNNMLSNEIQQYSLEPAYCKNVIESVC